MPACRVAVSKTQQAPDAAARQRGSAARQHLGVGCVVMGRLGLRAHAIEDVRSRVESAHLLVRAVVQDCEEPQGGAECQPVFVRSESRGSHTSLELPPGSGACCAAHDYDYMLWLVRHTRLINIPSWMCDVASWHVGLAATPVCRITAWHSGWLVCMCVGMCVASACALHVCCMCAACVLHVCSHGSYQSRTLSCCAWASVLALCRHVWECLAGSAWPWI